MAYQQLLKGSKHPTGESVMDELYELVTVVYQMRKAQNKYFRTRSRAVLLQSKGLEKKVDKLIEKHLKAGAFQLEILGYEQ